MISPSHSNQTNFSVKRPYSAEGFYHLDVIQAFREIGFSHTEAKHLLHQGTIKVWDTRVLPDGKHWEWYKRRAQPFELMEKGKSAFNKGSILLFGHPKVLYVLPEPVPLFKRIYWYLRSITWQTLDRLEDKFNEIKGKYRQLLSPERY